MTLLGGGGGMCARCVSDAMLEHTLLTWAHAGRTVERRSLREIHVVAWTGDKVVYRLDDLTGPGVSRRAVLVNGREVSPPSPLPRSILLDAMNLHVARHYANTRV